MGRVTLGMVTALVAFGAASAEPIDAGVIATPQQRPERPFVEGDVPIPRVRPARHFVNGWAALERGDHREAARWYREAALQGHADAQYSLGLLYVTGEGVAKDSSEAMKWFRKAAEQGRANAQFALGSGYALGEGVPQHFALAYIWYDLSAAQGYEMALEYRDEVAQHMTKEQRARARQVAEQPELRRSEFPFAGHPNPQQDPGIHGPTDLVW